MLISITTGKENFSQSQTQLHAFFVPTGTHPGAQVPMFAKAKEQAGSNRTPAVVAHGRPSFQPAGINMRTDIVGQWITQTFDILEGVVIKLLCTKSQAGLQRRAAVLLIARPEAPLIRLETILSGDPKATLSRIALEGRFEVMSAQDALQERADISMADARLLMPSLRTGVFDVRVLGERIATQKVVHENVITNSEGADVAVTSTRRKRMLNI